LVRKLFLPGYVRLPPRRRKGDRHFRDGFGDFRPGAAGAGPGRWPRRLSGV